MGTKVKVESNFINFELNEKEVTGYKLVLETKNAKYAKSNDTYQTLTITGDVQRIVTNNELIYKMIKDWTKIRYGMSADFYVKVTVTQVFMDEVFREIVFPNAYMRDFTETINPNTGEGSFVITLLQKIDKVGDIVFQPFDEEFREEEVHYEETLDSVKFMSTEAINEEQGEIAGDYYYIGSEDYYNNMKKNTNNEAINNIINFSIINGYSNKSQNKVVPVILKYIAEKNGYTVKTAVNKEGKSCIEMYKNNKVEREVYQYHICNGRTFVTTEFFKSNFKGWNERYHEIGDSFESADDAIMALGCIYYGKGLKDAIFKVNKISEKNFKIEPKLQKSVSNNGLYCKINGNLVYKYANGKWESVCNMNDIMIKASKAWGKKPQEKAIYEISNNGKKSLKELEIMDYQMSDIAEYSNGKLIGMKPYYVMVNSGKGTFEDDGGITIGYGHHINTKEWSDSNNNDHKLLSKYVNSNVKITGITADKNTLPRSGLIVVPNSSVVPINDIESIFESDVELHSKKIRDFLNEEKITINQNEFDALVIYRYNRGSLSEKAMTYLKNGNRNKDNWNSIWTGGNNRKIKCQEIFFGGKYNG